ncbi:formate/nitrite transporter family protein [Candidatus Kuenenia sp.]|uniref:formate/nitrite transporter family protein n=1 Tax=Candidatus Kuenenia sp. TaxID=2499824 RepID=UPI00321F6F73
MIETKDIDINNREYGNPVTAVDACEPFETAKKAELVGSARTNLDALALLGRSIFAGVFIALGTQLSVLVTHTATSSYGLNQLVGGAAFTLAMVLIVITGAELFMGSPLIAISFLSQKITGRAFTRHVIIAFIGNLIGALTMVVWIYVSEQWTMSNYLLGAKIILMANEKVNTSFGVLFARGMMGNALTCLGVWLCYSGKSNIDKILSLLWPVSCLMACGFEHGVVNMWLIPMGIVLKDNRMVLTVAEKVHGGRLDLSNLTFFKGFLFDNLCPVVLGNVI